MKNNNKRNNAAEDPAPQNGEKARADKARAAQRAGAAPPDAEAGVTVLEILREWSDALVIAFVLAMFIRIFIVELFKIPTGSMTPTLLGDYVAHVDRNNDGMDDLVVKGGQVMVFLNRGDRFEYDEVATEAARRAINWKQWAEEGILKPQYDRILVNKFSYWTRQPDRGDVVVFKVPEAIWDPAKPIYIKRAVGLPGDNISFDGQLKLNGEPVKEPPFFPHQKYINEAQSVYRGFERQDFVDYGPQMGPSMKLKEVHVPKDGVYVLGDNTRSSLDSRYWGVVPMDNLKGKAFFRYWPWRQMKVIR